METILLPIYLEHSKMIEEILGVLKEKKEQLAKRGGSAYSDFYRPLDSGLSQLRFLGYTPNWAYAPGFHVTLHL
jgi:hypothetical protein